VAYTVAPNENLEKGIVGVGGAVRVERHNMQVFVVPRSHGLAGQHSLSRSQCKLCSVHSNVLHLLLNHPNSTCPVAANLARTHACVLNRTFQDLVIRSSPGPSFMTLHFKVPMPPSNEVHTKPAIEVSANLAAQRPISLCVTCCMTRIRATLSMQGNTVTGSKHTVHNTQMDTNGHK